MSSKMMVLGAMLTVFLLPSVLAVVTDCSDCADCTTKLASASSLDTVRLIANISDYELGTCIDFATAQNITFDMNGHIIDGRSSGAQACSNGIAGGVFNNTIIDTVGTGDITNCTRGINIGGNNNTIIGVNVGNGDGSCDSGCVTNTYQNWGILATGNYNTLIDVDVRHQTGNYGVQIGSYGYMEGSYVCCSNQNIVLGSYVRVNNSHTYRGSYGLNAPLGVSHTIIENNLIELCGRGVYFDRNALNNTVFNNTGNENTNHIYLKDDADDNNFSRNFWNGNTGIYLDRATSVRFPTGNIFYDNVFNNTDWIIPEDGNILPNYFNTTLQSATNKIGGANIGGNAWVNETTGEGYGYDCDDIDENDICDDPLLLMNSTEDELPYVFDLIIPLMSVTFPPLGATFDEGSVTIPLNFTADDEKGIDVCWYEVDGGDGVNITNCSSESVSLQLTAGNHTFEVFARDNWGNVASDNTVLVIVIGYIPAVQQLPILGLIPFLIGIALIVSVAMPLVSGRREIDLTRLIMGAMMVMVGLAFIGVMYVV